MGNSSLVSINFGPDPGAFSGVMRALNPPDAQQQNSATAGGQPISFQNGPISGDMFQRQAQQQQQSPFFLPAEAVPKQQLEAAYIAVLQARDALNAAKQNYDVTERNYEILGGYLDKRSFQDQAITSLLQTRQQQDPASAAAASLPTPPPSPINAKPSLPGDNGIPPNSQQAPANPQTTPPPPNQNGMTAPPNDASLQAAQQQAQQAQQQYFQDLSRMRDQQLQQQQQMTPPPSPQQATQPQLPPVGQPGMPPQPQQLPQSMPGQQPGMPPGMPPEGQMPPTPPQTPPPSPQPMRADLPPQGPPPGQMPPPGAPQGAFPFDQMNQVLTQADPASRWSALEQVGKQKSAPPYIYNTLRLTAMPGSPLLPANFTPDEKRGLQEASFWTLALLNTSQNAQVPVSIALKDPAGKAVKDPKTGAPLYQFLPGLEEAATTLSSKKADPQVQRAAIQFLHEILQGHPNDPTLVGILNSTQSRDTAVRALAKQTAQSPLPPLPPAQQPPTPGPVPNA